MSILRLLSFTKDNFQNDWDQLYYGLLKSCYKLDKSIITNSNTNISHDLTKNKCKLIFSRFLSFQLRRNGLKLILQLIQYKEPNQRVKLVILDPFKTASNSHDSYNSLWWPNFTQNYYCS